ncbi:hypothetical protein [Mesomycoplasma hyopneumoniae]
MPLVIYLEIKTYKNDNDEQKPKNYMKTITNILKQILITILNSQWSYVLLIFTKMFEKKRYIFPGPDQFTS